MFSKILDWFGFGSEQTAAHQHSHGGGHGHTHGVMDATIDFRVASPSLSAF